MDSTFGGDTEELKIGSRFWLVRDLRGPGAKRAVMQKRAWEVTGLLEHGVAAKAVDALPDEPLTEYEALEIRAAPTKLKRLTPSP